jgi:tRNA A37 methylthiotransferase MiaB
MSADPQKTFYLEVFGCQMNVHDSEKVVGTPSGPGIPASPTVEEAGLVLYNTCSIRDKAEQKVFHRLADYKKLQKQGKRFGVLGCVAQQEGREGFRARSPCVLVCGSASYRNLPQMLVQLEAGKRVTGLDDRETEECFETEFTARTNPHRGYLTIIEGLRQILRLLRRALHSRQGAQPDLDSVLAEAERMADLGYTEVQLLGQNVNSYKDPSERGLLPNFWRRWARLMECAACVSPLRIPEISGVTSSRPLTRFRPSAITCTCRYRVAPTLYSTPCSASTIVSSIWSALPGSRRPGGKSVLPPT